VFDWQAYSPQHQLTRSKQGWQQSKHASGGADLRQELGASKHASGGADPRQELGASKHALLAAVQIPAKSWEQAKCSTV